MRKSKQSAAELEAIAMDDFDRVQNRKKGFELMSVRDRGWGRLLDYSRPGEATMVWHVDREVQDGELRDNIPDNMFKLIVGDKEYLFDAEDFRKLLRWI